MNPLLKMEIQEITDIANKDAMSQLADFMGIYYNLIDTEGNFIIKNKTFEKDFPFFEDDCLLAKDAWEDCKKVMETGEQHIREESFRGTHFLSIKKPFVINEKCVGVSIISVNITEKKIAEIVKDRFLESMPHDLNTALSGIYALTSNLLNKETDHEKQRALRIIHKSATHLRDYIGDVISHTSSKNYNSDKKEFINLLKVINGVVDLIRPLVYYKDIHISVSCPAASVKLNSFLLHKVLLNLLVNAAEFTMKGEISVIVYINKNILEIAIKDTGPGIEKEKQQLIFEEFYKVLPSYDNSTDRTCGLGLPSSKLLSEKMGGTIKLESKVGHGSIFTVTIPIE